MATNPALRRWTYDDFKRLPSGDGKRREIIAGELIVSPAPLPEHQEVAARLTEMLRSYCREHRLGRVYPGPVDVLFAEGDYFEPDLVLMGTDQRGTVTRRGIEAPPRLVVEILSASTAARDRGIKRERYALHGVQHYWLVDLRKKVIEVYDLPADAEAPLRAASTTLEWQLNREAPALTVDVAALFEDLDW